MIIIRSMAGSQGNPGQKGNIGDTGLPGAAGWWRFHELLPQKFRFERILSTFLFIIKISGPIGLRGMPGKMGAPGASGRSLF